MGKQLMAGLVGVLVLGFGGIGNAAPPDMLGYQGRVVNDTGLAVEGIVSVKFELFDAESGGTSLWSEEQDVTLLVLDHVCQLDLVHRDRVGPFAGAEADAVGFEHVTRARALRVADAMSQLH